MSPNTRLFGHGQVHAILKLVHGTQLAAINQTTEQNGFFLGKHYYLKIKPTSWDLIARHAQQQPRPTECCRIGIATHESGRVALIYSITSFQWDLSSGFTTEHQKSAVRPEQTFQPVAALRIRASCDSGESLLTVSWCIQKQQLP